MPRRLVVVGDANGCPSALITVLRGLRLVDRRLNWTGGRTVFVQTGDLINRGPGSRAAMDLVIALQEQARARGGDVLWLLGNHEVLSTLRNEAYVTPEEYLEFATPEAALAFQTARHGEVQRLLAAAATPIEPIGGRLRVFEEQNVPGKEEYRFHMGADGRYGQAIRSLPVAARFGGLVIVHGGLAGRWARLGIEGLALGAREAWARAPLSYDDLPPAGILRSSDGPLWHRDYCLADGRGIRAELDDALEALGASQMIVGHTRTDAISPAHLGRPLARFGGRLIMADVGLGDPGAPPCALVIEGGRIDAWVPGGRRRIARVFR